MAFSVTFLAVWHFGEAANRIIGPGEGRKEKLLCQLLPTHSTRHLLGPCHACRYDWRTLFLSIFGCHFIFAKHLFQISTFVMQNSYVKQGVFEKHLKVKHREM